MRRGDPEAREQQRRVADTLRRMAEKTDSYELFTRAQELGFQWGIINSPEDALNDPHFKARGFPTELEHPELGETFIYPGAPYRFTKVALENRKAGAASGRAQRAGVRG